MRHRLAKCGADLEAHWAWIEHFTYCMTQLQRGGRQQGAGRLDGTGESAGGKSGGGLRDTAVLLFGGNGYTKSGQGEIAERTFVLMRKKASLRLGAILLM